MASSKLDETLDFIELFEYLGGDWIVPPQFLRWSAISIIAACVEDRVWVQVFDHAPLYPNVWVFLIGGQGAGKDFAVGMGLGLIKPEDGLWKIDGKVTMPALYDYMAKQQQATQRDGAPVYLVSSDITEQLPLGPEAKDFTSRALALYGGRDRELLDLTRTNGNKTVRRPLMNWMAGCTKEWFPLAVDPIVFNSGFAGRAFFILGETVIDNYHKPSPTRRIDHDLVMDFLRKKVELFQHVEGMFILNERAQLYYNQWLAQQQERLRNTNLTDVERSVMNRSRASVLKLAMIFALSKWSGGLLVVKGNHMSRAINAVQEVTQGVVLVSDFAYQTVDTAALDKVRDVVRMAGSIRKGSLLRIVTRRGVKGSKMLDEILETLRQSGELLLEKTKPTSPGGPWPIVVKWRSQKVILTDPVDESGTEN